MVDVNLSKIELILPHQDSIDLETIKQNFKNAHNGFYYHAKGPLQLLLQESFLDSYIQKGKFYAFSHEARLDRGNAFAILPTGKLYLALDKDTYEQLGLEGKQSSFIPKGQRYSNFIIKTTADTCFRCCC
jgi:hypothetical protein